MNFFFLFLFLIVLQMTRRLAACREAGRRGWKRIFWQNDDCTRRVESVSVFVLGGTITASIGVGVGVEVGGVVGAAVPSGAFRFLSLGLCFATFPSSLSSLLGQ